MLRFLINNYLSLMEKSFEQFDEKSLSNIISNTSLINEIYSQKKFYNSWHNELDLKITDERYKLKKIKILEKGVITKLSVQVLHSFRFNTFPAKIKSQELINYLFIIKKIDGKNYIYDLCNKELHPLLYNRLLKADSLYFIVDNEFRNIKEISRTDFWKNMLISLKDISNNFHNQFPIYRSNYIEENNQYNNLDAIKYARKYALKYNKSFDSFNDNGGDCTNFVSQCINAGGIVTSSIWKPYTHPWLRVNELYSYLIRNKNGKDITQDNHYPLGSIIQFFSDKKGFFSHSGIITESLANGDYLYCCHSYDKLDFPLSEIYPLFYDKFRIIKLI